MPRLPLASPHSSSERLARATPTHPQSSFPGWDRLIRIRLGLDRRRVIAIVLAAVVSVVVYRVTVDSTNPEFGSLVKVTVATRDLPSGHQLRPEDLSTQWWPREVLPRGVSTSDQLGQTLVLPLVQNQILLETNIGPGALGLGPDQLGVTLPMPLAPPPLELGQHVLLVSVRALEGPFLQPAMPITDSTVVAIGENSVTVAVPSGATTNLIGAVATGVVEIVILPD